MAAETMFAAQRMQKIRELLLEVEVIDIPSLSQKLDVSEVTIRRDLDKLEKEGFIKKTYGGAVLNRDFKGSRDIPAASSHAPENDDNIKMITDIALRMINGDEAIFLGGGPISRNIARNINGVKRLMVVTNDIFVVSELYNNPDVKITVTGGELAAASGVMVGPRVISTLQEVYVSKAFMDIKGVDLKFGYSMDSYDEAVVIKEIINISKESIALADFSKFGSICYARLGDLNIFKKVISNKEVPEVYKKYYYDNYIKLFTTYDIV
jgi:DeoR/GlpR family transcriptional regulator of sugar metabolism